jgi:hypothetical protein
MHDILALGDEMNFDFAQMKMLIFGLYGMRISALGTDNVLQRQRSNWRSDPIKTPFVSYLLDVIHTLRSFFAFGFPLSSGNSTSFVFCLGHLLGTSRRVSAPFAALILTGRVMLYFWLCTCLPLRVAGEVISKYLIPQK